MDLKGLLIKKDDVRRLMPDVLIERPTIEEIMLSYIGGNIHVN